MKPIKTIVIFPGVLICENCGEVFFGVDGIIDHANETGHMQRILRPEPEISL